MPFPVTSQHARNAPIETTSPLPEVRRTTHACARRGTERPETVSAQVTNRIYHAPGEAHHSFPKIKVNLRKNMFSFVVPVLVFSHLGLFDVAYN